MRDIGLTLGLCAGAGNELTPAKAYTSLALFTLLNFPLAFLPSVIMHVISAVVALNRIGEFLLSGEVAPSDAHYVTKGAHPASCYTASGIASSQRVSCSLDYQKENTLIFSGAPLRKIRGQLIVHHVGVPPGLVEISNGTFSWTYSSASFNSSSRQHPPHTHSSSSSHSKTKAHKPNGNHKPRDKIQSYSAQLAKHEKHSERLHGIQKKRRRCARVEVGAMCIHGFCHTAL